MMGQLILKTNLLLGLILYLITITFQLHSTYAQSLKHNRIDHFDIISSHDIVLSKVKAERDVALADNLEDDSHHDAMQNIDKDAPVKKIKFSTNRNRYELLLHRPNFLITKDFKVTVSDDRGVIREVPFDRGDVNVLEGHLKGDPNSKVSASFNGPSGNLMTAHIKTTKDTLIVEPAYLHKNNFNLEGTQSDTRDKFLDQSMIVYNLSNHKIFSNNGADYSDQPEFLCGSMLNMEDFRNYSEPLQASTHSEGDDIFKIYSPQRDIPAHNIRHKKSLDYADQLKYKTRCTLYLVADYLFYKNVGKGDLQTTINYLLALINRVNQIYMPTKWDSESEFDEPLTNIGFTVQDIHIHQNFTIPPEGDRHYNMKTNEVWTAREYLDNFSKFSPPKHFCLAHLLTYRQFDLPVLGLAYVASGRYGTIGGICSPTQHQRGAFFKHNTGISTSKGITGDTLITRQADLVVAHELGHNLGAEHDSNECRPDPSNGGAYLMHPFAVMGFDRNNRFLSQCSKKAIGRVIRKMAPTCFVAVANHVCGNGIVEDEEECDGGDIGIGHNDPCCDSNCRFTPGSQCSDRHSWCCSNCRVLPAGMPCQQAEEYNCKEASYCDGRSADCPPAPPSEDDKTCVGRGLCKSGECRPFCEANNLFSCLCDTKMDACKLCCKKTINGTCRPYDITAPYLPDGVLCYRGVCEKGRCEQPIQDVIERLWDVLEDINFSTTVKILRDNIIFVVLAVTIPIWYIASQFINEFDRRIKEDVLSVMTKQRKKSPPSPFLPTLFVGGEASNSNSADDINIRADEKHMRKPTHIPQIAFIDQDPMHHGNGKFYNLETNL